MNDIFIFILFSICFTSMEEKGVECLEGEDGRSKESPFISYFNSQYNNNNFIDDFYFFNLTNQTEILLSAIFYRHRSNVINNHKIIIKNKELFINTIVFEKLFFKKFKKLNEKIKEE